MLLDPIVLALTLCVELGLIEWGYLRGGTAPLERQNAGRRLRSTLRILNMVHIAHTHSSVVRIIPHL